MAELRSIVAAGVPVAIGGRVHVPRRGRPGTIPCRLVAVGSWKGTVALGVIPPGGVWPVYVTLDRVAGFGEPPPGQRFFRTVP